MRGGGCQLDNTETLATDYMRNFFYEQRMVRIVDVIRSSKRLSSDDLPSHIGQHEGMERPECQEERERHEFQ